MEDPKPKNKLSRAVKKVMGLRSSAKMGRSNNGGGIRICILPSSNDKSRRDAQSNVGVSPEDYKRAAAVFEALIARLFSGVSAIKASYAELQVAQHPYDNATVQAADQAVVDELKSISELKRKFLRRELDISPQVTLMLSEIQEQQSLLKMYEITIKKLEAQCEIKEAERSAMRKQLDDRIADNKSIEKKLTASGPLSLFDGFDISSLNSADFVQVLHYALRSVRTFTKMMVKEMETAKWDLDEALKFIEPEAVFSKSSHKIYGFESYVCRSIFEGFNFPNFMLPITEPSAKTQSRVQNFFFDEFKKLKSRNPKQVVSQNPDSSFAKFTRAKYVTLVHAKMECSFFGNLSLRKMINSGGYPDSAFFTSFAEMCRRIWVLHCLAFSFDEEISIFQVKSKCRFSQVFMESVADEVIIGDSEYGGGGGGEKVIRVGFTVVPGFKIGKTVLQCRVYLSAQ